MEEAEEFIIPIDILDGLILEDGAFQHINDTYRLDIFPNPLNPPPAMSKAHRAKFEEIDLTLHYPNPQVAFRIGPNADRNRMMCWLKALWVFYEYLRRETNYEITWKECKRRSRRLDPRLKSIDINVKSVVVPTDNVDQPNMRQYRIQFYVNTGTVFVQGKLFEQFAGDHFPCIKRIFRQIDEIELANDLENLAVQN